MKFKNNVWVLKLLLIIMLFGNCTGKIIDNKLDFISTNFISDTSKFELEQVYMNPKSKDFVAIFFNESSMSFGSGNKIMKLYSKDSMSIAECFYGAHPLEIINWLDSTIKIECAVYSAHGDSKYREWYLDQSVNKNGKIGQYKIDYIKNYNLFNE